MKRDAVFDVCIIGGGISGLNSAQRLLYDTNLRIALFQIPASFHNNPARLIFKDIARDYNLLTTVLAEYDSFSEFSYHGACSTHHYNESVFVAIDYHKACCELLNQLRSRTNFHHYAESVKDITIRSDYVELSLSGSDTIRARLVIDASGCAHVALSTLKQVRPSLYSHSFGKHFSCCNNQNAHTACFIASSVDYGSGGGWFYPIGKHSASVGFASITDSPDFPYEAARRKFEKGIREVAPVADCLNGALAEYDEMGTIPIRRAERCYAERLLIVGDAAGQATPWNCMGVEAALRASDMAVKIARDAFSANDFSSQFLSTYQKLWEDGNRSSYDIMNRFKVPMWFWPEDVWDFIIEEDLGSLTPAQFLARTRHNAHLMSRFTAFWKWYRFKIKHFRQRKSYKRHSAPL